MAPLLGSVVLLGLAVLALRVHSQGFTHIPGSLTGFAKDANRHVFRRRLGGEGIICPKCKAPLTFQQVGLHPALQCTFNSAHAWAVRFHNGSG